MARRKAQKPSIPDGKARLNLLLDEELKDWAADFVKKKGTNLTALISNHFRLLKRIDDRGGDTTELLISLRAAVKEFESDHGVEQV